MMFNESVVPTYYARIYLSGPIEDAKRWLRVYCSKGMCVNITPTTYIYKYGEEEGYIVEIINYPRFPRTKAEIVSIAKNIAMGLMEDTCQGSFSIEYPNHTYYYDRRKDD